VTHDVTAAVTIADTIWLMGRDRDTEGNIIPGARIMEMINLIDIGDCVV
jgi:NitT/TauT family transport system ATP-binding protein